MTDNKVRSLPCSACPYRCDVDPGLWSHSEYEKLRGYDAPTPEQPFSGFACHATPENFCHGWAVVGTHKADPGHELISLRMARVHEVPEESPDVPLFDSHNDAADHGENWNELTDEAIETQRRLLRKYPRLTYGEEPNPYHST